MNPPPSYHPQQINCNFVFFRQPFESVSMQQEIQFYFIGIKNFSHWERFSVWMRTFPNGKFFYLSYLKNAICAVWIYSPCLKDVVIIRLLQLRGKLNSGKVAYSINVIWYVRRTPWTKRWTEHTFQRAPDTLNKSVIGLGSQTKHFAIHVWTWALVTNRIYMAFNRRLEIRFEPLDWHTCKESTGNSYDKSVEINNSLRWSINDSTVYS